MHTKTYKSVVLLPIQPRYASAIESGIKTVEFRKSKFKEPVSHVVVYSSSPVKKIVGYFSVAQIEQMSPQNLWRRYNDVGCIDRDNFNEYFGNCEMGVAISIAGFSKLKSPQSLEAINPKLKVPQSFLYLSQEDFCKVKRLVKK